MSTFYKALKITAHTCVLSLTLRVSALNGLSFEFVDMSNKLQQKFISKMAPVVRVA